MIGTDWWTVEAEGRGETDQVMSTDFSQSGEEKHSLRQYDWNNSVRSILTIYLLWIIETFNNESSIRNSLK